MIKEAEEIAKAAPYDTRLKRLEELETQLSKHHTWPGGWGWVDRIRKVCRVAWDHSPATVSLTHFCTA